MAGSKWLQIALALAAGCGTKNSASTVFHPTADASLPGGTHSYTAFTIPAGVTVTAAADTVVNVSGAVSIDGNLVGNCVGIDLEAQGALAITGKLDNRCASGSKDLIIHTANGAKLSVGRPGAPATLQTSGRLDVSNDPALRPSDFAILPSQRSATPLAPACAAVADRPFALATAAAAAKIVLSGVAAAPAGGGLAYRWDLGDGGSATAASVVHAYAPGSYPVALTATGDDGKTCTAKLQLLVIDAAADPAAAASRPPALAVDTSGIVAAAGDAFAFSARASSAGGDEPTYVWDFGDGATATDAAPRHAYAQAGRYAVTVTATDAAAATASASLAVYVYPAAAKTSAPPRRSALSASGCDATGSENYYDAVNVAPGPAEFGGGASVGVTLRGDLIVGGESKVAAQDGAPGADGSGDAARGETGGSGGGLTVGASGTLTLCQGAEIHGASGGKGGDATGVSSAVAGPGGDAGAIQVKGAQVLVDGNMLIAIGAGGAGGNATATARRGVDGCTPSAAAGGSAQTIGGSGGDIGDANNPIDFPVASGVNVTAPAVAGKSGDATSTAGAGGDALSCGANATGGKGGLADARSYPGGFVHIAMALPVAIKPGAGGKAIAKGGAGGLGEAVPPFSCAEGSGTDVDGGPPGTGTGGAGGAANAICAVGLSTMSSPLLPDPCTAIATGGTGGDGLASVGICNECGATAASANAIGGIGGGAEVGVPADPASSAGNAATGGAGGNATATGGTGGDCAFCPGAGADGGKGTAAGGGGGVAAGPGNATLTNGLGGAATANGGVGGAGASCCGGTPGPGGAGGAGGGATGTAGGGAADSGKAGKGGNGGDGNGPGAGGGKGVGAGAPTKLADGAPGTAGNACTPSGTCADAGKAGACGTFSCGDSATAGCSCGTDTTCRAGQPDAAQGGGARVYQYSGSSGGSPVHGSGISGAFTGEVAGTVTGRSAFLTNVNTIFGDAGQCVRWDYSGSFPSTVNLDMGTLTVTVGATVTTATKESDLTYFQCCGQNPFWTAAGQTVTVAASGAGANAAFSISGNSPGAFTVTAPVLADAPAQNSIATGSDYAVTWTGTPDGSSITVTLTFDSNTTVAGSEVICTGQTSPLTIPAALLQGLPASSTGVISITQVTPLTVSGAGFSWTNQLSVTPVDAQGALINAAFFKLSP